MKIGIFVVKTVAVLLNCLMLAVIGNLLWKGGLTGKVGLRLSFYCALPIVNLIAILLLPLASKSNR
ncbi:MAG: hypothetical protein ACYSTF_01105 [Planctomycetota bacterium]|jgi:hypothetical protein